MTEADRGAPVPGPPRDSGTGVEILANAVNGMRFLLIVWVAGLCLPVVLLIASVPSAWIVGTGILAAATVPFALPVLRRQWMWRRPRLAVPRARFALGEEVAIVYRRASRRPVDVGSSTLRLVLTCQEVVSYDRGSGDNERTHTDTETLLTIESTVPVEATIDGLSAAARFRIPLEVGGPSIDVYRNKISWQVEARLDGRGLPTGAEKFELDIAPVIATSARARPQDSLPTPPPPTRPPTNPYIHIDDHMVELGQAITGHAVWRHDELEMTEVRGLRLELRWRTRGRGDTARGDAGTVELPVDPDGNVDAPWSITVPADGPISYEGRLLRVGYELEVQVDRRLAVDHTDETEVIVLPRHGRGLYDSPHPLDDRAR